MANLLDPTRSDDVSIDQLTNAVSDRYGLAAMRATSQLDEDPDQAADSIRLSQASGVPATAINADYDGFQQKYKSALTGDVVRNNPLIADYVQSHPLAGAVSNDDYGNLDAISAGLHRSRNLWDVAKTSLSALTTPPKSFTDAWGDPSQAAMDLVTPEDWKAHPELSRAFAAVATPLTYGMSGLSATTQAIAQEVLGEKVGSQVGQAVMDPAFQASIQGAGPAGMVAASALGLLDRFHPAIKSAVRQHAIDANAEGVEALNQNVAEAQTSLTKERSPEMFQDFVAKHTEGRQIGIAGEKVLELYGNKEPAPGDGLLGDMPGINEQMAAIRDTGADLTVPVADWIAKIDPAVAKDLADDTRVIPGGITANEAKLELPTPPAVDESLPLIRRDQGLEPLFSIGDRKLQLQRMVQEKDTGQFGPAQGFHDFDMVNENGQPVGTINISEIDGGKGLHVDMINGLGEYYNPNRFGYALIRDLKRQLKAEFPNAEYITGHRVTGARDAVGSISGPSAMPKVKLDAPLFEDTSHTDLRSILTGSWMPLHEESGLYARVRPSEFMTENEHKIGDAVEAAAKRVAPDMQHALVDTIADRSGKSAAQGVFLRYNQQAPLIAVALDHPDPVGTLLHESIHHLKREGFFKPEEWQTLVQAAKDEGWIGKHRIDERYANLDDQGRLEESIADAYSQWDKEYQERAKAPDFQPTLVDQIFSKLKALFEGIKDRLTKLMGKEPSFEDLFQSVSEGEVGRRVPQRASAADLALSKPPAIDEPGLNAESPFANARDVGMTVDQHRRYMKLIEDRQQADLNKSISRIKKEQEKRQSAEWKSQSNAMRGEVVDELNARPDIAADKFFGLGEINGEKLDKTYRLDYESLTPEQRASIPERYTVRRGGVKPDEVAPLFGYQSGDQMLASMAQFHAAREASGLNREAFMREVVNTEVNRRMEREHGFLEKNIMEDAMDQVRSENQLDLLHEETYHLALMTGEQGFNLTRDQLVSGLKEKYDNLQVGQVSSEKFDREVAKHGRTAELALLANKPADAFKAKQAQYLNQIYANFAAQTEKAKAKLDKMAKPFRKTDIKNIEPEYLNHIQDVLSQAGYKVGRSLENIQENLGRREKTLEQFVNAKLEESYGYRDIPVSDFILEGQLKPVEQLTTYQLGGLKQTIEALVKNARDEQKIIREGETADRKAVITEMNDLISRFDPKQINTTKTTWDKIKEVPRSFIAGLTNMETFLNRMGDRDPNSVFNKYVTYPAAAAANRKSALQREYAKVYKTIGEVEDADKLVASPLIDPLSGKPFARFTRGNVAQMLNNAGNKSNWTVLAKGYGADPEALMNWLVANTKPEDWQRAQKLGKDVFGQLIKLSDQEYEHIHGTTIDKIPLEPITNAHGTFDGWYHPLYKDPLREGKSPIREAGYDDSDFGHITTANGYTKKRSGAAYPLDLNPGMTPVRINQMIHDISFRSFVLETQKLFKDPELSNTITSHYGAEYNGRNFLLPWLRAISGSESIPSRAAAKAGQISEFLRQNVISTYIGFSPFTAMKHGPTAMIMSMRQVGIKPYLEATRDLYARSPSLTQANSEFAMKWSEELQRRERHWQDTLFGAHSEIEGTKGIRENIIEKGSWLVAQSDMLSAKPTWLAAYRTAQERGETHGASIDYADAQVRMAHGSTAITNQPALVRGGGPVHNWLTSVYGFFGTAMQRRIELAQDINDSYHFVKQGEITKAANMVPSILADTFTYVIWPTIVEEMVTGYGTDDKRGLGEHIISGTFLGLASSVLYLRDIIHGLSTGQDIGVGLISSPLHDVVKAANDLKRKDAFTRQRMGKTVGDTLTVLGHGTGMAPKTIDNAIRFGIDLVNNQTHPRTAADIARGMLKGSTELRKVK